MVAARTSGDELHRARARCPASCAQTPAHERVIRTLREWTKLRRIPHHRLGHFVYYDPNEVADHIRTKLKVPARG